MKTTNQEPPTPVDSPLELLDESYIARGATPPAIERIGAEELPEPYRTLLVHETDMTSTLEKFHGRKLHIEVLTRDHRGDVYRREVALVLDGTGQPVEFGVIKILLEEFPPEAREEILRARQPLGRILNLFKIHFSSRPRAFLRLMPDKFISDALQLQRARLLYGRSNSLVGAGGRPLAEIVEILPP